MSLPDDEAREGVAPLPMTPVGTRSSQLAQAADGMSTLMRSAPRKAKSDERMVQTVMALTTSWPE